MKPDFDFFAASTNVNVRGFVSFVGIEEDTIGTPPQDCRHSNYPRNPPFTCMFCPVMKPAPGPQRKRTVAAMSAGSPRRPASDCTSE